jgi:hypothetical protein
MFCHPGDRVKPLAFAQHSETECNFELMNRRLVLCCVENLCCSLSQPLALPLARRECSGCFVCCLWRLVQQKMRVMRSVPVGLDS